MVKARKDSNTEEKILIAARQVFIEKGLAGARMQDIADRAEINKAMLHYYFKNKDMLFEVIFRETAGKLFPHFEKLMESLYTYGTGSFLKLIRLSYRKLYISNPRPYFRLTTCLIRFIFCIKNQILTLLDLPVLSV